MDPRVESASGDTRWNWPCLILDAAEIVDLRLYWTTQAGETETLPTDADTIDLQLATAEPPGEAESLGEPTLSANVLTLADVDLSDYGGVYRGMALFNNAAGDCLRRYPFIASIRPDTFGGEDDRVTIDDLRTFLYDRLATENALLADVEFPDRVLFDGICGAVRVYNDMFTSEHSTSNLGFPNREMLRIGAAAYALNTGVRLLARNRLNVSGQADQAQRLELYAQLAATLNAEYKRWCAEEQREMDMLRGYGLS